MQLFAAYAKVKRKTFWVVRYVEITSDGVLYYRDKKEDRQNKLEYKLLQCKVKELVTNGGLALQILHRDEILKIMAHTQQEHKKIVQAIQQIKQNSESKSDLQQMEPQPRQTQIPSIIIQQTKPPSFQPDADLIKQNQGDQIKVLVSQLIKKFETSPTVLINVVDGVQVFRLHKEQQNNAEEERKKSILDSIQEEIKSVGYLMTFVIGIIFFLLISILIYLLLSIVDNRNYTYSIIITLNIITYPLIFKKPQGKKVVVENYTILSKYQTGIDYNGLVYLLNKQEIRKEWTPNLQLINVDNNLVTTLYFNQSVEKFVQTVYCDQDCFYFVEHHQLKILRLFIIKYLFDDDNVEITCITDNTQIQILPCLKQFLKLQRQNPKSLLIEYLTNKNSFDQASIIQSEILYKPLEQTTQSSSPIQQYIEPPKQQTPIKANPPSQIVQQQSVIQQNQYPPEVQRIFTITLEAKELLEKLYPLSPAWQQQSDKGGFKIHTRFDEASGQTMSRGEGILPYTISEIFEIIEKVEKRGDYDSLFDSGYMLKRLDPDTGIVYQRFKTIKIVVKSRDFAFVSRVFKGEDRWVIIAKSIDVPELPPIKDSVRGELLIAGWILEKTEQGTKTCFITMVDPKGSIPAAIVASSAKEQGQCVEKVKNLLDKRNRK